MLTIGRLAARYGLSRSTLLYYDSIGLLRPSSRSAKDYRRYSQAEVERLEQICLYRRAGLSLKDIQRVLEAPESRLSQALEARLEALNADIERLRDQQRLIVGLLRNPEQLSRIGVMNKQTWVALLAASGFSEEDMHRWHVEFEHHAPEKHLAFLRFLCLPDGEIARIRAWAKDTADAATDR